MSKKTAQPAVASGNTDADKKTQLTVKSYESDAKREDMEFGGPIGCLMILIFSHVIPYYLWYCLEFNDAKITLTPSISVIIQHAWPTWFAAKVYLGFILFQYLLAAWLPGFKHYGLPLPHEGGKKLEYNCNAIQVWYVTLVTVPALHFTGILPLTVLMDHFAPILTVAMIFSNIVAFLVYTITIAKGRQHRMSGNFIYDYFMGAALNPRIGTVDLKMFTEARLSWIVLFLLTCSAACKMYEQQGYVSGSMIFMMTAHFLYANAIMKGEECVITSWDIFYEKWGWLLIFWNLAGVPFVYCFGSMYLMKKGGEIYVPGFPFLAICFLVLFFVYYIWDTAQAQRNRFRMMLNNTYKPRNTFPQLPWSTLHNPKSLDTKVGSKLLIDGWWAYARKIHYTCDIVMALLWGLVCGFGSFIPYFYFCFFTGMIIHRNHRDQTRCAAKYKEDWVKYCKIVPYVYIPYVL